MINKEQYHNSLKQKNVGFIQVPLKMTRAADKALPLLLYLLSNQPSFKPALSAIEKQMATPKRTIQRWIKVLSDAQILFVTNVGKVGKTNYKNDYRFQTSFLGIENGLPVIGSELKDAIRATRSDYAMVPRDLWKRGLSFGSLRTLLEILSANPYNGISPAELKKQTSNDTYYKAIDDLQARNILVEDLEHRVHIQPLEKWTAPVDVSNLPWIYDGAPHGFYQDGPNIFGCSLSHHHKVILKNGVIVEIEGQDDRKEHVRDLWQKSVTRRHQMERAKAG